MTFDLTFRFGGGSLRATCSPDPHFAGAPDRILTLAHGARPNSRSSRFRRARESAFVRQSRFGCRARLCQAAILREKQYMSSPFVYRTYSSMKAAKPSSDQNCPRRLNRFWFCEHCEEGAVQQAENLARHPALFHHVALMPDAHLGYGMPIGGVVAADNTVIPAAVGVDIGCGMIAVETDVPASRFAEMSFRRAFHEKLKTRIPVGEGVSHKTTQTWDGFESYAANNGMRSDLWPSKLDRMNLGTLGGAPASMCRWRTRISRSCPSRRTADTRTSRT